MTPSRGVTPEGKKLWANLQRMEEKRGRIGKKGVRDTLEGVDTRVKAIKRSDSDSDSDEQKRSLGCSGKNRGVTPSVAARGVATGGISVYIPTQNQST